MPKASIAENVPATSVVERVPREFRSAINSHILTGGPYTVISFPATSGQSSFIVDSSALSKALARAKSLGAPIVVVAANFTSEAREMLVSSSAVCFSARDFSWSDATWAAVRGNRPRVARKQR